MHSHALVLNNKLYSDSTVLVFQTITHLPPSQISIKYVPQTTSAALCALICFQHCDCHYGIFCTVQTKFVGFITETANACKHSPSIHQHALKPPPCESSFSDLAKQCPCISYI